MIMRRTRILAPLVAVPLAVLVAFAGPAAAESKSDKAILKAGVITKDDVPASWTSKKASSSEPDRSIRECRKIRAAIEKAKKNQPRADSRDFSNPITDGATSAQSTVYAFKDATAAGKFLANFQGDAAATCLQKSIAKSPVGKRAGAPPTVSPVTDLQGVGDEAAGHELTIDVPVQGQLTPAYIDFIAIRVGRAFVGFGFTNVGERIPEGPGVVQAVVARVADAQASK
jgi:hypothetical protein